MLTHLKAYFVSVDLCRQGLFPWWNILYSISVLVQSRSELLAWDSLEIQLLTTSTAPYWASLLLSVYAPAFEEWLSSFHRLGCCLGFSCLTLPFHDGRGMKNACRRTKLAWARGGGASCLEEIVVRWNYINFFQCILNLGPYILGIPVLWKLGWEAKGGYHVRVLYNVLWWHLPCPE